MVTGSLYTAPAATLSFVTLPVSVPFTSVTGMSTANGAPASTFARTWLVPTFSTVTVSGSGLVELPPRSRVPSEARPKNRSSGSELRALLFRESSVSAVRSENTPASSEPSLLLFNSRSSSAVRPVNTPSGSELRSLMFR